jgi:hypothetical protein
VQLHLILRSSLQDGSKRSILPSRYIIAVFSSAVSSGDKSMISVDGVIERYEAAVHWTLEQNASVVFALASYSCFNTLLDFQPAVVCQLPPNYLR